MQADSAIARRFLLIGGTVLPIGIALGAIGAHVAGSVVAIVGAALLIAGLHTFGRAGPDPGKPADSGRRNERG
jgi:hypothetical protein